MSPFVRLSILSNQFRTIFYASTILIAKSVIVISFSTGSSVIYPNVCVISLGIGAISLGISVIGVDIDILGLGIDIIGLVHGIIALFIGVISLGIGDGASVGGVFSSSVSASRLTVAVACSSRRWRRQWR